MHILRSYTTTL